MALSGGFLAACGNSSNSRTTEAANADAPSAGSNTIPANSFAPIDAGASETAPRAPSQLAYHIGTLDVLEITVFKVPDLTTSVQVAPTGTINLPLVGEIKAAGLTSQQLERELTRKLGDKYLQNPQVTVFVKEYNSQRVVVEGAVRRPGVYPLKGAGTLLQVIAQAEGLETRADSQVIVLRQEGGRRYAARFDLQSIKDGQLEDPEIKAGDTVVVGTSAIKEGFENLMRAVPVIGLFTLL